MSGLAKAAEQFCAAPDNIDAMTEFLDRLAREDSVQEIAKLLSLDYERTTGHLLARLCELVPNDADLYLSLALWNYHFGLDERAHEYLERAKELEPRGIATLQTEIYLNYSQESGTLLSLCQHALELHPHDEWIHSVRDKIERLGKPDQMLGPPMSSKWQKLIVPS